MPEAISTPNLVALPITSQELGRGFLPLQTKIGLSNSATTIGLNNSLLTVPESEQISVVRPLITNKQHKVPFVGLLKKKLVRVFYCKLHLLLLETHKSVQEE